MDETQSGELCAYYRLCRYLGIFCIDYNPSKKKYLLRRSAICYVVHFAIQTYLVGCITVMVIFWRQCFKRELTKTGNHFDRLVMVLALGILVLQNAWLIWLQAPHLRIVRLIELYRRKHLAHLRLLLPRRLLWLIIATNLVYMVNFIKTCVFDWLSEASRLFVFTSLGFPLRYLVTSFTMGTYFCMVHIIRLVLSWNQSQIADIVAQSGDPKRAGESLRRMRGCLELHDRLVILCSVEISLVYGFIAWLAWMFASLDVTGVIYLTMVIQTNKSIGQRLVTNIVWLSPTLMTCAAGFMSNRVAVQVAFSSRYSAMSFGEELRIYLLTLKAIGLLCFTHDSSNGYRSHASRTDDIRALVGLLCSQCLTLVALSHMVSQPEDYEQGMNSQVGSTYLVGSHGLSCLAVSLIHLYFYVRRRRIISLISLLLHHSRVDLDHRHATEFVWIYALVASQVLLTLVLQGGAFLHSDIQWWKTALLGAFVGYSYMLLGLVVALHYCLVRISASLLRIYNEDLAAAVRSPSALSGTPCCLRLRQRSRLLWVCCQRINSDFGLVLLLITAFLLFAAIGAPFFIISITLETSVDTVDTEVWQAMVITLIWNMRFIVLILITLRPDKVRKEVSIYSVHCPLSTTPTRHVIT